MACDVDHPLDEMFSREMRHVVEQRAVEHREVDDALDTGLAGQIEGHEGLRGLVGDDGIQQEEGIDALESLSHRGDVAHVALHGLGACRQLGLGRVAGERSDLAARVGESLDDLGADGAGAACHQDGHGLSPRRG